MNDCKTTHTYCGLHTYEERDDGRLVCKECGKVGRYEWERP